MSVINKKYTGMHGWQNIKKTQENILFSYPLPDRAIFLVSDWTISLFATAILVEYANSEDLLQVVAR
jgi:hypothetical protein